MVMKKEADVKDRIKEILKAEGAWWFMYVPTGYGVGGVPDFIACVRGRFVGIEAKFGYNKATPLQQYQMTQITKAGGVTWVVDETNVEELVENLRKL